MAIFLKNWNFGDLNSLKKHPNFASLKKKSAIQQIFGPQKKSLLLNQDVWQFCLSMDRRQ
jgi:hypothetical protein